MLKSLEVTARIKKKTADTDKIYREMLGTMRHVKQKINGLELRISQKGRGRATNELHALDSATNDLIRLSDSLIATSAKARDEYRKLETECQESHANPAALQDMETTCRRIESLAADLLCYSLAASVREEHCHS